MSYHVEIRRSGHNVYWDYICTTCKRTVRTSPSQVAARTIKHVCPRRPR
ncbi:hypothetical protein OHU17_18660 [Streptomyces goshikiensis]|uniref:Uncharacterized protein n=1 Tax=Streptomyces goshikiensis TaxID=1942 RepID=A0ABZ1RMK2_9ACTN|nr:hypothetical protein [Streptomyces goshikiensis]